MPSNLPLTIAVSYWVSSFIFLLSSSLQLQLSFISIGCCLFWSITRFWFLNFSSLYQLLVSSFFGFLVFLFYLFSFPFLFSLGTFSNLCLWNISFYNCLMYSCRRSWGNWVIDKIVYLKLNCSLILIGLSIWGHDFMEEN